MVRIGGRSSLIFVLGLLMFSAHICDTTAQENSVRNGEADAKSENVDRRRPKERTNPPPRPPRQNPTPTHDKSYNPNPNHKESCQINNSSK